MTIETANRLYELRKKHNLSQEELAEKLGVSRQAVSKWERSEASPDTDNLIALAKLYNLSLDELIYGEKEEKKESEKSDNQHQQADASEEPDEEGNLFIDIEDKNDRVKIGPCGIFVESNDGDKVKIDFSGIKIQTGKSDGKDDDEDFYDDEDDDDDDDDVVIIDNGRIHVVKGEEKVKTKIWMSVPYPIICTIAYLLFGCLNICGGWGRAWIVFITIPIFYSIIGAIYKRKFSTFAYPVFTALIFFYLGLYHGIWHPSWIIFITVPIYYPIADAIDRKIRARRWAKENNQ